MKLFKNTDAWLHAGWFLAVAFLLLAATALFTGCAYEHASRSDLIDAGELDAAVAPNITLLAPEQDQDGGADADAPAAPQLPGVDAMAQVPQADAGQPYDPEPVAPVTCSEPETKPAPRACSALGAWECRQNEFNGLWGCEPLTTETQAYVTRPAAGATCPAGTLYTVTGFCVPTCQPSQCDAGEVRACCHANSCASATTGLTQHCIDAPGGLRQWSECQAAICQ